MKHVVIPDSAAAQVVESSVTETCPQTAEVSEERQGGVSGAVSEVLAARTGISSFHPYSPPSEPLLCFGFCSVEGPLGMSGSGGS